MSLKSILNVIDSISSNAHVKFFGEKPALNSFLFHACLEKEKDYNAHFLYPQERLTIDRLKDFLDYFLSSGYEFIAPDDVFNNTFDPTKRYGFLTFDDGYYNNHLVLPILESFGVPAVFYIPTYYFTERKIFWSDALYFFRKKQHQSDELILKEVKYLKSQKLDIIEDYMYKNFGSDALSEHNDMHRFMTESEFINFAAHPLVHIGNHTHRHEVLTLLSQLEVYEEFKTSQKILEKLLGYSNQLVSYPNGSFNESIINSASQQGLKLGHTTIMQKNEFPLDNIVADQLILDRFNPVFHEGKNELSKFKSSFQLKTSLKKWLD